MLIGTLNKSICKDIVKPAYKNYRDISYDLIPVKSAILGFLKLNQQHCQQLPEHIDNYKLNIHQKNKLRLSIKHSDNVSFIICPKSGKVFMMY